MICPTCQTENKDSAKFCVECGTVLAARCPSCGADHEPGQKFCAECGAALAASAAPAPAAAGRTVAAPAVEVAIGPAELRVVSVLFVDLVGYTSLSEERDAEEVRDLLGRYFETARTIVGRYGGSIEKFIGDAVMAVWGVPVAREDDAERAVRAGLEVVDAVTAFGEEVRAPELRARAGVVTGQVASMASAGEGLVVGDRVNTASRVQATARPGTVYVDAVTRQVTSAAIAYEDAGEHEVKGKTEPLPLWRAVRVIAGIAGSQREEGLEAPFLGRDSELRLVKELFHAGVDRGAARLVAVSGPAGVGKTRLRWEFAKYVDGLASVALWHSGRCLSYGDGVAYWALAEMVSQRLGIPEDASAQETSEKLAAGLERWVVDPGEREFLAPRLGTLLGIAAPGLSREELFAGWRLFLERLAEHDPVVLVFEDMQWADEGLLDFIEHLLDWSSPHPIFMLTLARPDLSERREAWPAGRPAATLLHLEPLDDAAMAQLLDGLATLPAEARERIVSQAEGVPLYAIETVRALADRGVLAERDGSLALVGELGDLDVPPSLNSLLAARLDALDPEERELVKSMSVFGGSFPRATAAALSGIPEERLDAVLAALVRKQVLAIRADPLSPDRGQYGFGQTLLRTVAYDMLSRRERKPRHVAAAEHLRRAFPDDGEEVAEVIAAHYLDAYGAAAGDDDAEELRARALAALRRAGQRAATVGAPEVAERAYRTAIDLATDDRDRAELAEAAGLMALQAGRYVAGLELLEEAESAHAAAGRDREAARLGRHIGGALGYLGRNEAGIQRMLSALEVLGADRLDPEVGALSAVLGRLLIFSGRFEEAGPYIDRALDIAETLGRHDVFCEAITRKALLCHYGGRPAEARILYDGAIGVAEEHGLSQVLERAQNNSGDLRMAWDLPGAGERLEAALATSRRIGNRSGESLAAGNLMLIDLFAGRWEEVQRLADELLSGPGAERPDPEYIHERLGWLHALRGEREAARTSLARIAAWERSDDVELRGGFATLAALVATLDGQAERTLALAAPIVRELLADLGPASETVRQSWPSAFDAALALGRREEAAALVTLIADRPPGQVPPYLRAHVARGRGLVAAAGGKQEDVETDLREAVSTFRSLGYPYWLARAQTDLAAWLIDQDRATETAPLLDEATATLERLGAEPALQRARALGDDRQPTRPGERLSA